MTDLAIDRFVPPAVLRDLRRMLADLRARGARRLMLQIPAEDFAATITQACEGVYHPFVPTIDGVPCAPWEKDHVGVMAQADAQQTAPILFTADGREHPVT